MVVLASGKKKCLKKKDTSYSLDCTRVVEDEILSLEDMKSFYSKKMFPDGKTSKVAQNLTVSMSGDSIVFRSKTGFSKQYIKYLAKKYLAQKRLRDYIRVISKGPNEYELKYFDVQGNENDIEELKE